MHLDCEISCHHNNVMLIEFDSIKRAKTLAERGPDFAHADSPHHLHEESK
jgi:hypothetical protein